ncbi:KTSC domain-containing protein [Haloarculaceae archaeon H-GB11]|nr:KTSC domain-containing protein [Haloarculaceae archaeon H-GB11]
MMAFDSSNLVSGLYDRQTRDLYIRFHGDPVDRIYVYLDVPEDTWQGLKNADSHGSYHHEHIKWDFVYEELTDTSGWPQIGASAPTDD